MFAECPVRHASAVEEKGDPPLSRSETHGVKGILEAYSGLYRGPGRDRDSIITWTICAQIRGEDQHVMRDQEPLFR